MLAPEKLFLGPQKSFLGLGMSFSGASKSFPRSAKLFSEAWESFADAKQLSRGPGTLFFASKPRELASKGRLSRRYPLVSRPSSLSGGPYGTQTRRYSSSKPNRLSPKRTSPSRISSSHEGEAAITLAVQA